MGEVIGVPALTLCSPDELKVEVAGETSVAASLLAGEKAMTGDPTGNFSTNVVVGNVGDWRRPCLRNWATFSITAGTTGRVMTVAKVQKLEKWHPS